MLDKTISTNQLWGTGYYLISEEHVKDPSDSGMMISGGKNFQNLPAFILKSALLFVAFNYHFCGYFIYINYNSAHSGNNKNKFY